MGGPAGLTGALGSSCRTLQHNREQQQRTTQSWEHGWPRAQDVCVQAASRQAMLQARPPVRIPAVGKLG